MLLKIGRIIAGLIWCFCSAALAQPQDGVLERGWVEDPTGQMTLEQVRQAPQHALTGTHFNQGYSASAFWIRLRIDPSRLAPERAAERLIMRISPPYLDELQLYDPLQEGAPQVTGDLHPPSAMGYSSLNLNFSLPKGAVPRDVWVRMKATSATLAKFQILTESQARKLDWRQAGWSLLVMAALLICLGWGLLAWWLSRDRLILYYIWREVVVMAYALVVLGWLQAFAPPWLAPAWTDRIGNILFCLVTLAALWFDIRLLAQYRAHPWLLHAMRAIALVFALATVLATTGTVSLALRLNSQALVVTPLLLLLSAWSARAWADGQTEQVPEFPRWTLVGLYLVLLTVLLLNRAVVLSWIPPVLEPMHAALMYLLLGSFMMMGLLQVRSFRLHQRQQAVHLRLQLAEQTAHDERLRREEQERFLAMLGHELRNPLAAVGFLADGQTEEGRQIRQAVNDMAQVLARSVQSGQLASANFSPQLTVFDLHALLQEVCGQHPQHPRVALLNVPPGTSLHSDRLWLSMALSNLLDNALKYSPPDSQVQVQAQCTRQAPPGRDSLRIRVVNTPGAAGAPDPSQLFQKYYRSPQAHHQIGSGLGLYLVKGLLDALAGSIVYQRGGPEPSASVVFEIDLPMRHPTQA